MELRFEWDPKKAAQNLKKHGVPFEEARTVFGDPLSSTIADPSHSAPDEERFATVGHSSRDRTLKVVHVDRGCVVRIVSARLATRSEREAYEEGE